LGAYNVAGRYLFNSSSANAEEIIIYLIISCYVIGIGLGEFGNSHIRATVVTDLLGHRTRQVASFISAGSTLLFAGLMIWYGIEVAIQRYDIGEVSATSLKFPQWIVRLSVPIGFFLVAIAILSRMVSSTRKRALETGNTLSRWPRS
jgi:TRAP-type C4-dicarboxylate transport system permease small subunit